METLDLYVEAGIRVELDALCLLEVFGELLLVSLLDGNELLHYLVVVLILFELLELVEICNPLVVAQKVCDEGSEVGIAGAEPSSRCNAVCLVGELLRIDVVPVLECLVLEDVCVECGNAVYGV